MPTQIGNSEYYPASSVIRTFSIQGLDQEIIWDQNFSNVVYGDTLELDASASSGLPVDYSLLQGDASLAGNRLTLLSASRDVVIQARQVGNNRFAPAASLLRNFRVSKAPLHVFAKDISLKANATKMPKLSFSYDGLLMNDKNSSIDVPPEIGTTRLLKAHPDNIRLPFLEALQPTTTLNSMMELLHALPKASAHKDQLQPRFF